MSYECRNKLSVVTLKLLRYTECYVVLLVVLVQSQLITHLSKWTLVNL